MLHYKSPGLETRGFILCSPIYLQALRRPFSLSKPLEFIYYIAWRPLKMIGEPESFIDLDSAGIQPALSTLERE